MTLLGWAFLFFVIALVAALFGFGGIAASAVYIARVLFGLFLIVFLVLSILALVRSCDLPVPPVTPL